MSAKGCFTVFFALILLGLLVNVAERTWPVCLPAGMAMAGWHFTRRSTHPLKSAAHALLGPIAIGLLIPAALLFMVNVTSSPHEGHVLHATERALVYLDTHAPRWTRLSTPFFVTVLTCLVILTLWLPRWRLVSRFAAANKLVSKGVAAIGAATTFTFFSNVAVIQPKVPEVHRKIEAIHRDSRVRVQTAVGRFLAARAAERALTNMSEAERAHVRLVIEAIASAPALSVPQKEALATYVMRLRAGARRSAPVVGASVDSGAMAPQRSLSVLDRQLAAERAAEALADELEKGVRELVVKTLKLGTDELKTIGWSLVDTLIDVHSAELGTFVKAYSDKVADKYFERLTDPAITAWSKDMRKRLVAGRAAGPPTQGLVGSETYRALIMMSENEAGAAAGAAETAWSAARAAKVAANAGDLAKADAELGIAARASTNAMTAAELGEASSKSVARLAEEAASGARALRAVSVPAEALDAAEAMRLAGRAAQAARAAKAAAEAVKAARAARAAAQAGRFIKVFI